MRLNYFPDVDSLYIKLKEVPGADAQEIADGFVVDFDADGNVVGLDIEHASEKLDLQILKLIGLSIPVTTGEQKAGLT